jgi:multimeric flavodoxin WrbA
VKQLLIVYHSQGGNTRRMAEAVAEGAGEIEGLAVQIKTARQITSEDLLVCDGLVLGSPEYFGYMAGRIKDLFDRTYESLRGHPRIFRKPYAAFISAGNDGSGALQSIERICTGFQFKKVQAPVIILGPINEAGLAACRVLGRTLAAGLEAGIF